MAMSSEAATEWALELLKLRKAEQDTLDLIRKYWRGKQPLPIVIPKGVPSEVRKMAEMARINVVGLPIDVVGQALYVDGYRAETPENEAVWDTWQANKMDARQIGVHRAALAYGASYVTVLPGDTAPVFRGRSPRTMTVAFADDDDDWPAFALERRKGLKGRVTWRLFDETSVHTFVEDTKERKPGDVWAGQFVKSDDHNLGVCPVVRFRNHGDLDDEDEVLSEITPLMPLQDQMDFTTFDLLVAQHFTAFRQRYVMGWTGAGETEKAKAAASRLWTFDDPDTKVGEFGQTDLGGYLDSRESTLQHLATISQTPPHYLLGKLVNLSAEALAAAEAGQRRKIGQRETTFGEAWEQVFSLAAIITKQDVSDGAQVRWRDTEARALASTVDALGKMAQMLDIPREVLWERIPGWTQQDVEAAKAAAAAVPPAPVPVPGRDDPANQ